MSGGGGEAASDDGGEHEGEGAEAGEGGGAVTAFRVEVDRGLCQGHGVCESEAPAVFAVSKKGELSILDDRPPEDQRAAVELAVRYCPTHALTIVEEDNDADQEGEDR